MSNTFAIKYRPKHINDIIGQEKSIMDIKKRMADGAWSKAIVLSGMTGTGKSTCARIVAKSILCNHKDKDGNPCNECDVCKTIDEERSSNYYFELNASNLGINEMRDIEVQASQRVLGAVKAKVFVIDETQELNKNKQAQKNILKLLESQGDTSYFILNTMEESKVVDAIKDRCIKYNFKPIDYKDIAKNLLSICKKENINVAEKEKIDILFTIAQNSGGSVRRSLSYLERVVYSELWNKEELFKELNIISYEESSSILEMLLRGNKEIFKYELNEELLRKLRYNLMILIKMSEGVDYNLNVWHKSIVKSCEGIVSSIRLIVIMDKLNEMLLLPYLTDDIIEFSILKIIKEAEENNAVIEEPKRRRLQS